jgi:hypothetical protein
MRKQTLSLLAFAGALGGCAAWQTVPEAAPAPTPEVSVEAPASAEPAPPAALERKVGDYMVHMISGTFRKQPAMLTERVVGREDDVFIIELELEDTQGPKVLRAWIDRNGEVQKVTRMTQSGELPAKLSDYEALIASVSVAPDENEGLTASTTGTCLLGPSELECETKSYRVRIGEKEASLGITQSAAVPGSDLAGEITLADGTVIFRSELVARGNRPIAGDASVALLAEPASAPAAK